MIPPKKKKKNHHQLIKNWFEEPVGGPADAL